LKRPSDAVGSVCRAAHFEAGSNKAMHRVEHNRREDGAAFRAYFDGTADALFVHDETGDIVDVNREACESLGYSRQELIGRSLRDVDANGGVPGSFAAGGGASADADEMRCFETSHRRKDGIIYLGNGRGGLVSGRRTLTISETATLRGGTIQLRRQEKDVLRDEQQRRPET